MEMELSLEFYSLVLPFFFIFTLRDGSATWPPNQAVYIPGDVMIGGLLRVHQSSDQFVCGQLMRESGVQSVEALIYTLDRINNGSFLPGFTMGLLTYDDCNHEAYSLEQSVKFVRLEQQRLDYRNGGPGQAGVDPDLVCSNVSLAASGNAGSGSGRWAVRETQITGVVGASSSTCSMQVANLLKLFKIPQVAYWATIDDLSNKDRFPYLFRTVPPDHHQVQAMLDLLRHFNWTYVSIVHDTSNYAVRAVEELTRLVNTRGICLATTQVFPHGDSGARGDSTAKYDDIVAALLRKPRARVVIVWSVEKHVYRLLQSVRRANKVKHFVWIGSDSWSGRRYQTRHNEAVLEGAITIHPTAKPIPGFDDYFKSLRPDWKSLRNPWLLEYWEVLHNCMWSTTDTIASYNCNVSRSPFSAEYPRRCNGHEQDAESGDFRQVYQLQFVADALLAFAHALKDMHAEFCGNATGLCERMQPVSGDDLKTFLSDVRFNGITGTPFSFDEDGDGPAMYTLLNYQQVFPGEYRYVTMGHYSGQLHLNESSAQFKLDGPAYPSSACSTPCQPWEKKVILEADACCWRCESCADPPQMNMYLLDDYTCSPCEDGTRPNDSYTGCVLLPAEPIRLAGWSVVVVVFACMGIFVTVIVGIVFVIYRMTPLVKASGKELMAVLLFGVVLCYSMSILFFVHPTSIICSIHQLMMSHGFTVCYSALLVKTNRVHRIFQNGRSSAKRPDFISPASQVIITIILIGAQAILSAVLMAAYPPRAVRSVAGADQVYLVCSCFVDHLSLLNMAYPILLMLLCTAYAFLTRKIPSQFNEAKFIGFTLYTTCIIWLAMVPIYVLTQANMELRIVSFGFAICLSATVSLACLFAPKVYVVLFRPSRNVRMSVAVKQVTKCHHMVPHPSQSACSHMEEESSPVHAEREQL